MSGVFAVKTTVGATAWPPAVISSYRGYISIRGNNYKHIAINNIKYW
jgi:hypothetical protein